MGRALRRFLLAIVGCIIAISCVGYVGTPVEGVKTYYDDPVRGWYVDGYWTGGCLNCGVWIAPFWTRDIVILNNHWSHYHGAHFRVLERHIGRFGGHSNYRHHEYQRYRQQQFQRQQQQRRYEQRRQRQQQRYERRQQQRRHQQQRPKQRQQQEHPQQQRRHEK